MNGDRGTGDELRDLLWAMQEGSLSPGGVARIDELVRGDQQSLRHYVEHMRLVSDLRFGADNGRALDTLTRLFDLELVGDQCATVQGESSAGEAPAAGPAGLHPSFLVLHPLAALAGSATLCYLVVLVLLGAGILLAGAWRTGVDRSRPARATGAGLAGDTPARSPSAEHRDSPIAAGMPVPSSAAPVVQKTETAAVCAKEPITPTPAPAAAQGPLLSTVSRPLAPLVGRITGLSDIVGNVACDDIDRNVAAGVGTPVRLNWTFLLTSGRLEMTYDSGAKVVIEGPASYSVWREDGGFLALGKLIVDVHRPAGQPGAVGKRIGSSQRGGRKSAASNREPLPPPAPVFVVDTLFAEVRDTDGQFVLSAEKSGATRAQVLRGQVQWCWWTEDARRCTVALKEKYRASVTLANGEATIVVLTGRPMGLFPELERGTQGPAPVAAAPNVKNRVPIRIRG